MNTYIYPQNLKETAKMWLWSLKDLSISAIALLISIVSLTQIGFVLPLAGTLVYAFLSIQLDDTSILDFIKRATKYFITTQQIYIWRLKYAKEKQSKQHTGANRNKGIFSKWTADKRW
jgi:hypothetical protein